ncbi:hypothetical protein GGTG_13230 [Gaeumannomyces tritici R3-111a-1]|uniref:Uncharacterized protein n=1 Tax=Gaeumannomyces tritici (strain R3-111a-1) TaxID=644352 RepID=J3PIA2_GAET3|nr:hypothetical protein GGTG_13230 [Gaeumannomyces tritici R3-111a-1]EJT69120.1 hypothetical protein GGTG_13230 [Gaeumannomyces tritici R3-111a-1]
MTTELATKQGKPAPTAVPLNASKNGHPFRLVDGLLYNRDAGGTERLVIPQAPIPEFLEEAHDQTQHFGRDRVM